MIFYIIIIIALVVLIGWMLFFGKPKKAIAQPLTGEQKKLLLDHVDFYTKLDQTEKLRFEKLIAIFLAEVRIEGVGMDITDLDRLLVASSAVIPIFGFPEWRYQNLTNIILYPDTFNNDFQFEGESRNIMGMVGSGYMNGQMLLSRAALVKAFSASAGSENTALHEFVHLLDKADGATDGIPQNFLPHEYAKPWLQLMHREMHRISKGSSDINPYALTNEAEFLAVASEYFFEKPEKFKSVHPELYAQLSQIFAQQPAG
jgi:hypothetical protein